MKDGIFKEQEEAFLKSIDNHDVLAVVIVYIENREGQTITHTTVCNRSDKSIMNVIGMAQEELDKSRFEKSS